MKKSLNWLSVKLGTVPTIVWVSDAVYIRLFIKKNVKSGAKIKYREENNLHAKAESVFFQGFVNKTVTLSK